MIAIARDDDRAVVVIGSGAGGGTVAKALCDAGIPVVLLEAGPHIEPEAFVRDEWTGYGQFTWDDPRFASGTWSVARDHPTSPVWHCRTVGGSTVHWLGIALRFAPHEFRTRSTYGPVRGADLLDWPITGDDLAPYYDRAERILGVTGTNGLPHNPPNNNHRVFAVGAERLGYEHAGFAPLAINAAPYDGRPGSNQDGFTLQGDRARAKWCTLYVEIERALATGRLDLRPECRAVAIEHDASGRATAVVYADRDGVRRRQRAAAVVVAGNAIETPRLLLASTSGRFPTGLANDSGMVGRHYMRHVMGTVWSIFDGPVRMNRGETMPGLLHDEARHDPGRGFVGGYFIEVNAMSLPALAILLAPGAWGREHARRLEHYASIAGMIAIGEDMPQADNRVTLDPARTDRFGVPLARVHYDEHPNDIAMRNHGYRQMGAIHRAAGAAEVIESPPFPATHNLGTCRMSARPEDGVVDAHGRAHEVPNLWVADGSVFTTSGAPNPTLTIVALALRQAEAMVRTLRHG